MLEISVIVPFYNVQEYLAHCIDCLLSQNYPKDQYEIILVDNNSTDDSVAIAKKYSGIRLLFESKQGSYAARNRGIKEAKGEIIAFVDSDCSPKSNWLSGISQTMASPNVSLVLGKRQYNTNSNTLSIIEKYEFEKIVYITNQEDKELYYGYTNNMAVRRKLFDEVGLFQERSRGADTTFVRQVVDKLGCSAVQCNSDMEVLHLEMNDISTYYKKSWTYGKSNQFTRQSNGNRPLSKLQNWRVYRQTCQKYQMSYGDRLVLFLMLTAAAISYSSGQYVSRGIIQINKLFPKSNLEQDVV